MTDPSAPAASEAAAAATASRELVDVVDDDGIVIRVASRREVRADNLLHRSVFVAVLTSADEVIVHQRAAWKDVWPSRWDVCFGGVVDAGEDWDAAAVRELAEEAGVAITADQLVDLGAGRYEDAAVRELARLYRVRSDGPFAFADGEVVASERVPLSTIADWAATHDLCDDSRALVLPNLLPSNHHSLPPEGPS